MVGAAAALPSDVVATAPAAAVSELQTIATPSVTLKPKFFTIHSHCSVLPDDDDGIWQTYRPGPIRTDVELRCAPGPLPTIGERVRIDEVMGDHRISVQFRIDEIRIDHIEQSSSEMTVRGRADGVIIAAR